MPCRAALVVDDDVNLVKMIVGQLNRMGLAAHGCCSHAEARQILPLLKPALLIADVRLPDGDGMSLCEATAGRDCQIIITGQRDATVVPKAQQRGAHLVPKTGDLWKHLERIIRSNVPLPKAA